MPRFRGALATTSHAFDSFHYWLFICEAVAWTYGLMAAVIDLTGTSSEDEMPEPRMGAKMARADAERRQLTRVSCTVDSKSCPDCGRKVEVRATPSSGSVQPIICPGCRLSYCGRCGLRSQYHQTSGLKVGLRVVCHCSHQHLFHMSCSGDDTA